MKPKVDFRLILVTDRKLNSNLPLCISRACNAGIKAVLLREKDSNSRDFSRLTKKIRTITSRTKTKLLLHKDELTALFACADGFHLPEKSILHLKPNNKFYILAGISVHSVKNAIAAEKLGFDYILFGPVYRTPAKVKYGSPMGLAKLKDVCASVKIPVFAVGGINPIRAAKCINNGASGVAVIRDLMLSKNITKTVKEYKRILGRL